MRWFFAIALLLLTSHAKAETYPSSATSRAVNTNFTPSATRWVYVNYTFRIVATATLNANQNALIQLLTDSAATPTTEHCRIEGGVNLTLGIAVGFTNTQTGSCTAWIKPGDNVRLAQTLVGAPTVTFITQREYIATPEFDPVDFTTGFPFR